MRSNRSRVCSRLTLPYRITEELPVTGTWDVVFRRFAILTLPKQSSAESWVLLKLKLIRVEALTGACQATSLDWKEVIGFSGPSKRLWQAPRVTVVVCLPDTTSVVSLFYNSNR